MRDGRAMARVPVNPAAAGPARGNGTHPSPHETPARARGGAETCRPISLRLPSRLMHAIFLYNPAVVQFDYGRTHPFRLERLWLVDHLCERLGLFAGEHVARRSFEPAVREALVGAHGPGYLDALETASLGLHAPAMGSLGLGSGDNPVFPALWDYVLHTAGGSLTAAQLLLEGQAQRVFHPGGGLHHAHHDRAAGFCYVNDVVLALQRLAAAGRRIFYLDLDAHHGDGVQTAFYGTRQVLTLSVHQDGRTLFPGTGFLHETGEGEGEGYAVNVPLLPGMSDPEYERIWTELVEPLLEAFAPDVLVTELGADALLGDPLANLELHLSTWWRFCRALAAREIPWLAVGGGGYDLSNAMRAWTLVWMAMVGAQPPAAVPPPPEVLPSAAAGMRWPGDFWSAPAAVESPWRPGPEAIDALIADLRRRIFPHHGL
ncbi:MAG: acetoin utilization protein AcuC [Candidatus Eisenbacteria bacterium]|nr:acetoin utilization protein AcuC [Candidatus Eisenbacteria bacterium]